MARRGDLFIDRDATVYVCLKSEPDYIMTFPVARLHGPRDGFAGFVCNAGTMRRIGRMSFWERLRLPRFRP